MTVVDTSTLHPIKIFPTPGWVTVRYCLDRLSMKLFDSVYFLQQNLSPSDFSLNRVYHGEDIQLLR